MTTPLERALPAWDFCEVHRRRIAAEPDAVWAALQRVGLRDLRFGRVLVALRHPGRSAPAGPLLTAGPIALLESRPPAYALAGSVGRPWQREPAKRPVTSLAEFMSVDEPGWVTYLTDFRLTAHDGGTVIVTETRGRSTDAATRRRFALYWAIIRPWSGLVRRELLAAVAREARRAQTSSVTS